MAKNAHLTFDERQTIEVSLRDNLKFKEIGEILRKDPSTISKEVRNHYKVVEKSTYNPCANRRTCKHYGDICKPCKKRWGQDCKKCDPPCYTHCPDFEEQVCLKLKKPPYVCNGCDTRQGCKLKRHLYEAKYAQNEYEAVRSESRQGFAISSEELKRIDYKFKCHCFFRGYFKFLMYRCTPAVITADAHLLCGNAYPCVC